MGDCMENMRVKVFINYDAEKFEQDINDFCATHSIYGIEYAGIGAACRFSALVMYKGENRNGMVKSV